MTQIFGCAWAAMWMFHKVLSAQKSIASKKVFKNIQNLSA